MIQPVLSAVREQSGRDGVTEPLYPLRFEPILKRLIWGGRRLGTVLGKPIGAEGDYAESWEVSDYHDDVSRVAAGPLQGLSLRELLHDRAEEILGPTGRGLTQFPLLVKFIDAHQVLSVQVHPDDSRGRLLAQDNGKTEMWVIVHAEPGSLIYAGLNAGVTLDDFRRALDQGNVEPLLHRFEVKAGDSIFIPAGTVHAIGSGILLAEVQQMSDATFRVDDWGRVGADGRPRPLHREQAMQSIDFESGPVYPTTPRVVSIPGGSREELARCPYFVVDRWRIREPVAVGSTDRFTILLGLRGSAEVRHEEQDTSVDFGQTLLLPAALGSCVLTPRDGEATVLACSVP